MFVMPEFYFTVYRTSESNIQPISSQIENLYLTNSRADVTETLISLVFESCVTPVLTPERLAMELMMLVAILHGNVGSEVGEFLHGGKLNECQSERNGLHGF